MYTVYSNINAIDTCVYVPRKDERLYLICVVAACLPVSVPDVTGPLTGEGLNTISSSTVNKKQLHSKPAAA